MNEKLASSAPKLKKTLGVAFGVSMIIGGTIGAGILRTPGSVAALLPNEVLILSCWLITGLYILLSASSYAELTTMLPKVGGAFNYIQRAFGHYTGFVTGWFDFVQNAIAPAFFCVVLGEYTAMLFPQLIGHSTLLAAGFLTLFTLINLPGVKSGSTTQQITSFLKVLLFLVLITGCFLVKPAARQALPVSSMPIFNGAIVVAFFKAMQLILSTYDGWMSASFFAEENDDPGKSIPRSYFIGASAIIVLYILVNAAILYILPVSTVAGAPLAASAAAKIAFGSWGGMFINIVAIFTIISILNAYMMIPPRILFGISREGFFIKQGTYLNKGGTPYYSMLVCYGLSLLLILNNSYEQLFGLGAVMLTVVTSFSFAALLWLRKKEPDLPRPYKAWGYPYMTILALLVTLVLLVGFMINDVRSFLIVASLFIVSWPFYKLIIRLNGVKG
ncbi:amino acid permease [Mucilaginibacter gynuensis]|uniref:Amino acid permease n=1 Tax=Mucilaginibacter gynuensis TaxID=1302236 RepID=A0ABP8GZJ4_9SPHI